MKKLFLFFMAMIICQYSFGQGVTLKEALEGMSTLYQRDGISHDFHTSHISEDAAYEAPNSALTKKWFFRNINEYVDDYPGYIQFFPNGTLKMYWEGAGIYTEIPGKWQRSKQDLKLSFNYPMAKCNSKDLSGYSLREKDNINKGIAKIRAIYRKSKVETESRKILRMDDLMVLDIKKGLCAYLVSEEYLVNKAKTKAEEEARKAKEAEERAKKAKKEAEEAQKARELQGLNSQAYTYARAGKFDEAILAIDKAIAQQPQNANWYDSKGEILYLKGDKDGAKEMYNKVISIDPNFKDKGSVLCFLMDNQGWKSVGVNFPNIIPFKKIRVKKASGVPSEYCCVFFTTESGSNRRQQDTNYCVNYFMNWIYNGHTYYDKRFKKCTDVGDGWFEYEYSQTMYFSHYQKNAPKDCLQVLIE